MSFGSAAMGLYNDRQVLSSVQLFLRVADRRPARLADGRRSISVVVPELRIELGTLLVGAVLMVGRLVRVALAARSDRAQRRVQAAGRGVRRGSSRRQRAAASATPRPAWPHGDGVHSVGR